MIVDGYAMFPRIFTADFVRKNNKPLSDKKRFSVAIVVTDPTQIANVRQAEADALATLGEQPASNAIAEYDTFRNKEYYRSQLSGALVISCTRKEEDGPVPCVYRDASGKVEHLIDRSKVFGGAEAQFDVHIASYTAGRGGVGAWINGILFTGGEHPAGRFDGRKDIMQVFGGAPAAPAAPAAPVMTPKAAGATYESFIVAGWTDEMMRQQGYLV